MSQACIISCLLPLQETIDRLTAQLEAFQAKMKRAEESILSRDYKKHIQVGGQSPTACPPSVSREVQVWAVGKASPLFKVGARTRCSYLNEGLEETVSPCH